MFLAFGGRLGFMLQVSAGEPSAAPGLLLPLVGLLAVRPAPAGFAVSLLAMGGASGGPGGLILL